MTRSQRRNRSGPWTILVCLALGAISTLLTAWLGALWDGVELVPVRSLNIRDYLSYPFRRFPDTGSGPVFSFQSRSSRRLGATVYEVQWLRHPLESDVESSDDAHTELADLSAWARQPPANAPPGSQTSIVTKCCGFPFRALAWQQRECFVAESNTAQRSASWKLPTGLSDMTAGWSFELTSMPHPRDLPLAPLWTGFLANTFLFAFVIFTMTLPLSLTRQLRRYKRGECPKCRYPVQGNYSSPCPECGWGHRADG